jgi:hypothetical protein
VTRNTHFGDQWRTGDPDLNLLRRKSFSSKCATSWPTRAPCGAIGSTPADIVLSLGRDIESSQKYTSFIQADAPIISGNSCGFTFDLQGQVIWMNSIAELS